MKCPNCHRTLEFSGPPPLFCAYCGGRLGDTQLHLAETVPPSAAGVAPAGVVGPDRQVGEYRLVRELGQGGMGMVWQAEQADTGRLVALKLLSPRIPHTPETVDRFLREARLAASLSHPRSTFVFGAGEQAGQPYIVMELMPGDTLNDLVSKQGPLPVQKAVDYILDVMEGLEAAHALGIIHRDVKPSNCFLDADGRVKVGDFGLSKSLVSDTNLTRTGAFLGTPLYSAPEQIRGQAVDHRTDIYAVGATLFYLIANRGPFAGDPAAVIAQIASDKPAALRSLSPQVPVMLDRIVAKTLEKNPEDRFQDIAELRQALLPYATGGTSIADVGRRLAAYMLDVLVATLIGTMIGMLVMAVMLALQTDNGMLTRVKQPGQLPTSAFSMGAGQIQQQGATQLLAMFITLGYFAIAEGHWGRGLGKLLMGLRVVGWHGEKPGIARALLRSFFIPGGIGLSVVAPLYMIFSSSEANAGQPFGNIYKYTVVPMALSLGNFAFTALCLSTMRARNGYRALHELVSGTRVIRLRGQHASERFVNCPMILPRAPDQQLAACGPFEIGGELGQCGNANVWQGYDAMLGRSVWIHAVEQGHPVPPARCAVARPTRPRWLQGGNDGNRRWDAFEAVLGSPLESALARPRQATRNNAQSSNGMSQQDKPRDHAAEFECRWEQGRFLLLDLAEELAAAQHDGTLPDVLQLAHVWLDRDGRVKLLDAPLRPPVSSGVNPFAAARNEAAARPDSLPTDKPGDVTSVAAAVGVLRQVARAASRGQTLPLFVQEFLRELESRPANEQTLTWAADQLREISARNTTLRWDDRLGILGATMGTEFSVYLMWVFLAPICIWQIAGLNDAIKTLASFFLCLAMPIALCGWLRGGPVFRFMKISVLRRDGHPASRLRCAWRALMAWGPLLFFYGAIAVLVARLLTAYWQSPDQVFKLSVTNEQAPWVFGPICGGEVVVVLFFFGVLYAIARPNRGWQDLLAGTILVPR